MKSTTLGTQLQIGDGGGPEVFTTVAQITNIGGPELNVETEDTLAHDSPGGFREHVETGIRSFSDIPIEGLWDAADATQDGATGLRSKAESAGPHNWKIIWPDASTTTVDFAASLTNLKFGDAPTGGALRFTGTLKISGQVTWT